MRGVVFGIGSLLLVGCGSAPPPTALENRVFYQYDDLVAPGSRGKFERPYPPLDLAARPGSPEYIGVAVIDSKVRISRPTDWILRRASLTTEQRFVEYVSPKGYAFTVYERTDSPEELWPEVLGRYEEDVKASGIEVLGARIPVASRDVQGRQYTLRKTIKGQRAPYRNIVREVLYRGDRRIVLVQVVLAGEVPVPLPDELLRTMDTIEVR
jgi:hypothetical protein